MGCKAVVSYRAVNEVCMGSVGPVGAVHLGSPASLMVKGLLMCFIKSLV